MLITKNNKKVYHELIGQRISLFQYRKKYVQQYRQWFVNDPQLLELTASQLLTIQQELQNHQSWLTDPTKYIFIIFNNQNRMIGDVNIFFSSWIQPYQVEINIMIAVKQQRGKGYAKEVLKSIEWYVYTVHEKREMIAKIKDDNVGSIKLFQTMGYKLINHNTKFKQYEYRKILTQSSIQGLKLSQISDPSELYK